MDRPGMIVGDGYFLGACKQYHCKAVKTVV